MTIGNIFICIISQRNLFSFCISRTIINIQKTGYANILSVTSVDNAITQENTLLEDLKYKKIDVLNKLNSDLARKRRI